MTRAIVHHLFYLLVVGIAVFSLYQYQSSTIDGLTSMMVAQAENFSQEIQEMQGVINKQAEQLYDNQVKLQKGLQDTRSELGLKIKNLETTGAVIASNVQQLGSELQQKESQIQSLSSELQNVKTLSEQQVQELQNKVSKLKAQNQDFSEIIDQVIPAVVSIQAGNNRGSGYIIDSRGYVVTNQHVIAGGDATVFTFDGQSRSARLVNSDATLDIAVLKIDGSVNTISFGDSDGIKVGEKVIAIGSPVGLDFSVTQGIVSAVNRVDSNNRKFIQIDVPINPGNSGGPLVNIDGKVIGMNTMKVSGFEGLGFALVSNQVKSIVEQMIAADNP